MAAATTLFSAPSAQALPLTAAPRVLTIGDSLAWQTCSGQSQQVGPDAGTWLQTRDGGCYGFSGAAMPDMAFMIQGGRFYSPDPGQPHPYFPDRGQANVWSLDEAMSRAQVLVVSLGTNDANRRTGCGTDTQTPWPIQVSRPAADGGNRVPCELTDAEVASHIDYFMWRMQGDPVFWYDVAVTNTADPAYAHQGAINRELYAAMARHPNLHVIRWAAAVKANPGYLRSDGVHLTDAGRAARWALARQTMSGCGIR